MFESKSTAPTARRVACAGCGTVFGCGLSGSCWCSDEDYRMPLPDNAAEDCLCPDCLRKKATEKALMLRIDAGDSHR
ncbi:MAG TPA: cysteine-rich CWC family protein [Pseudolabrys sp.]|nr:cysteine-rich CWC family protein [Pseudolabrys sp.]